ncbi:MAG: DUF2232 domain-containing protein [Succiniclasticum sp.]
MALTYGRNRRSTSAMVEGAIFAAIAIVFNLLFYYVPFVGVFINLIMPLPIVICGIRNGMRYSILSTVVASAIVAMLISPVHSLFFLAVFGIMGVALGECVHRQLPMKKLFVISTAAGLVSIGLNLILALYVLGIDPVEMMFNQLDAAVPQMTQSLSGTMGAQQAAEFSSQMSETLRLMKIILPGAMILVAPCLILLNYWLARKVMARAGVQLPGFPPAERFGFPRVVALLYILGLIGLQYLNSAGIRNWVYTLSANVWTICSMLLVVQGLIGVYWWMKQRGKNLFWFRILVLVSMFLPIVTLAMTYVGGYDILFDPRGVHKKNKPGQ